MEVDEEIVEIEMEGGPSSSDSSSPPLQISLTWDNIHYQVQKQGSFLPCRSKTESKKTLLNHVSGHVEVGECVAVMGPSGCGKSTLLDVLAGRVGYAGTKEENTGGYTGEVRMAGMRMVGSEMKKHVSYVMQDDALYGTLTVRENLYYSAMLRLPDSMSKKEKLQRVEEVIEMLGLTKCADTKVGTPLIRGVSGGERRRCSIGMELITRPSILLLDEPTSGLDAKSSRLIIQILKQLSQSSRVVLFSIHQPSSEIYQLFDKVLLLSKGKQVFYGSTQDASSFFEKEGYQIPPLVNPADYFLEIINTDFVEEVDDESETTPLKDTETPEDKVQLLAESFSQSGQFKELMDVIKSEKEDQQDHSTLKEAKKYETGFFTQLYYLCSRRLWVNLIDLTLFWSRFILFAMMGVIIGSVYFQMGNDQDTINDRLGSIFYIVTFLSFMSIAAMPSLLIEREIFIRERKNGYYTVLPYSLSHSIMGIPFIFVMVMSFCVSCYFMAGYETEFENFIYFFCVLFASCLIAEGVVMSIGALAPSYIIGIVVAACLYGVFMLNGGFIITAKNIPDYYIWIHYIVFQKYAFEGLVSNEFSSISFPCEDDGDGNCLCYFVDLNQDCIIQGEEILEEFGYEDVSKWGWFGVLIAMALFFHTLFFVFLRFFNTGERT